MSEAEGESDMKSLAAGTAASQDGKTAPEMMQK
jgi:hypothetical protein